MKNKLLLFLILGIFAINLISALEFDNSKSLLNVGKGEKLTIGDVQLDYNPLWEKYAPIEIKNLFGLGETLMTGAITEHTSECGVSCYSVIQIYLANKDVLVQDIRFDNPVRSYQIYIQTDEKEYSVDDYETQCITKETLQNGSIIQDCSQVKSGSHLETRPLWQPYTIGTEVEAGTYTIKLEGKKAPTRTVDWQIKTNGVWTTDWAVWQNTNLSANLQAYYRMDETTGDIASNSRNPLLYNGTFTAGVPTWHSGKILNSAEGINNPMNTNYFVAGLNQSVAFWFKKSDAGQSAVLGTTSSADDNGYQIAFGSNEKISLLVGEGNTWTILNQQSTESFTAEVWNYFVMTYNQDTGQMDNWINGAKYTFSDSIGVMGTGNSALYLFAGGNYPYQEKSTNISIDEAGVWNRVLTDGEIADLYNGGSGLPFVELSTTLNSPIDNYISTTNAVTFNCSATTLGGATIKNISLWTNQSGSWSLNDIVDYTGTGGITNTSIFVKTYSDGTTFDWTCRAYDSDGVGVWASENRTISVDTSAPAITINLPTALLNYGYINKSEELNYSISDLNLASIWYNYNGTNKTLHGAINSTTFLINRATGNNLTLYANDSVGNVNLSYVEWSYRIFENTVNYTSTILESQTNNIIGNFTLPVSPSSIVLNYNGTNYAPSISIAGNIYTLTNNLISPIVNTDINASFYYIFIVNGTSINSTVFNQTITNVVLTTNCSGGYNFLNISNYDEETLLQTSGVVEYTLNLLSNSNEISSLNGTNTGTNITLCVSQNLSNSYTNYNLQLRYYLNGIYLYKTYNIQNSLTNNLPIEIPLYFLNVTAGTQFKINYVDFNYLTYPNAIMQIQRQYLSENIYRTVEIPKLDNNGKAIGSFNTNNIRYKIIVINNGVILDTFNDIFPVCQNIVLGQCELNLRGVQTNPSSTTGDFTYTLSKTNDTVILTYIIPSGTPRTVEFITNQDSRFINNITSCSSSIFASGGTINCPYNETIGDSIISTHVNISDGTNLYGQIQISEDLSGFYLLNNFFIAFILILTLVLMFISSGVMLLMISAVGLIFLSLIFLLKGFGLTTLAGSIGWLIVAVVIAIYKISQKEERT